MKEDLESRLNAIDTGHAKHSSMFSEEARLWGRGKTVDPHESDFELVSAKGDMSCSFLQPPSFTITSTAWAKEGFKSWNRQETANRGHECAVVVVNRGHKREKSWEYFIFGALCPSKSGLMNKHIVKHIVGSVMVSVQVSHR